MHDSSVEVTKYISDNTVVFYKVNFDPHKSEKVEVKARTGLVHTDTVGMVCLVDVVRYMELFILDYVFIYSIFQSKYEE